ncbi:MAG: hypothetical protein NT154_11490 [Verrucomicrobia bacterium]|nr:hypothetical protein [Verrucomicrobiota bacterium]
MGDETIELLPLRNWSQLDHYKWTVRGKLPGAPAGLEIALDHVRMAGETVAINDPEGCEKLERLFNDWFLLERETLELARKKARPQPSSAAPASLAQPESQALRFRVEVDKRGQVHIHCVRGKETLASIGLSVAGFKSLYQQGLMRKPNTLESGALHDWVELDGELCSFEKGQDAAVRLEQILNERYVPAATVGPAKEVAIFLNPASSSGFDIQFPIVVAGVPDNHRRHLDEQSLGLLQDPDHCGLLHRELIIKLIPPNLVFKRKTPDGGEHYLAWGPEHTVNVTDEEGQLKTIQLSQPLNLLRLGRTELNAVFNHPTINRHTKAASPDQASSVAEPKPAASSPQTQTPSQPTAPPVQPIRGESRPDVRKSGPESATKPDMAKSVAMRVNLARPAPNLWLEEILAQPLYHHEWIACLMYRKMAEWFGNSNAGNFGPCDCWFISRGELEDIAHPEFHGIFITEKGSLGFLNKGQMARFYNRIAFIGPQQSALEGIQVDLVAVGLDARQRLVFILNDNYRRQFSVPEMTLAEVLSRLRDNGAVVLSVRETLANPEPLDVVWIVPAEQPDPSSPEAQEHTRAPG